MTHFDLRPSQVAIIATLGLCAGGYANAAGIGIIVALVLALLGH